MCRGGVGFENDEICERHQPKGGGRRRGLRGRGRSLSRHYQNPPCSQHTHAPQKTSRETDKRTPKQAARIFVNLVFLRGDAFTRRKFIYVFHRPLSFSQAGGDRHGAGNMLGRGAGGSLPLYCSELPVRIFTVPLMDSPGP